ncbi:hypothetical protein ACQI4F_19725 [Mycolicibacterium vaccae]|uniref:hypothetical protein n=1 Tax=Mycolicibacterium vaccae TaxID=1810 RepID=UPI003CF8FF1C
MSISFRLIAAAVGVAALAGAVGVDVAEAGTYPKGGSYHSGGEGATVEPSPDPTTLSTASFTPQIHGQIGCGAVAWGGGCG